MKKIASVFLLTALLMTLAACGKKSGDAPAESTSQTATTTDAAPTDNTPLIAKDYASLDFTKYLEIPDLSAIKLSRDAIDEEWASLTNTILYQNIAFTDAAEGDSAELTDSVNIHYKGYAASADVNLSENTLAGMTNFDYDEDGKLLAGYDLVLGSNSFITAYESETNPEKNNKGFEEQLIGAKVGETRTITVTFPDNYGSAELNGTVVKFDVTINSLQKGTLPTELTDEMVSKYTSEEYATIDELKAYVTKYQEENLAYKAVFDAFTVKDYPADLVNVEVSEYVSNYINANYDEVLSESESKAIYNEQYDNALENAHKTIGEHMILEYLFGEFDITLTQSEYIEKRDADFKENSFYYIYYYGISDVNALESTFGKDVMVLQYKYEMLLPKLVEAVTFE